MNTGELWALVEKRYPPGEYALMDQVANSTGFSSTRRWADGVVMSLWPSRGLRLSGLELKISRTDWKKELSQPEKAETICCYCDHWWIVAADSSIVREGELPPTWGLMVPNKRGILTTIKEAPKLTPKPIDRPFLCALMRSARKPAEKANEKIMRAEYERGRQYGMEQSGRGEKYAQDSLAKLQAKVLEFEKAAGFSIGGTWDHPPSSIGRIVKEVMAGEHTRDLEQLTRIHKIASEIVTRIGNSGLLQEQPE